MINKLFASVAIGAILTKNAPALKKEAPIRRGGKLEVALSFEPMAPDELKKAIGRDVPEGYIAGWASTSGRDLYNHEVVAGAFQKSIDERGITGPRSIKLLLDHDHCKPAGVIQVLEYRRGKLWMEAQLNLEIGYVKDRWNMLKMLGGANFSVGFVLQDYEVVIREEEEDYYLRIDRGDLFEISVVMLPGNEEAQMTFVKGLLSEDNPDEDELFFAKTKPAAWRVGASKNLPIALSKASEEFDVAAVRARLFKAAGFDGANPDYSLVRKAFLSYDIENPTLRLSYKVPFCDIVDGKLQATEAGVRAALSRLPTTDLPDSVRVSAKAVLEHYQEQVAEAIRESKDAPDSIAAFEKALVARGLAKGRNDARAITSMVKSSVGLFTKSVEDIRPQPPALDAGKLTEALVLVQKMKSELTRVVS